MYDTMFLQFQGWSARTKLEWSRPLRMPSLAVTLLLVPLLHASLVASQHRSASAGGEAAAAATLLGPRVEDATPAALVSGIGSEAGGAQAQSRAAFLDRDDCRGVECEQLRRRLASEDSTQSEAAGLLRVAPPTADATARVKRKPKPRHRKRPSRSSKGHRREAMNRVLANNAVLSWSGRTTSTASVPVAFDHAGVSVRFVVTGTTTVAVILTASARCRFIAVVDGDDGRSPRSLHSFVAHGDEVAYNLTTSALSATTSYAVELTREVEFVYGTTYLHAFVLEPGAKTSRAAPLHGRMEIISESTALGYGVLGHGIGASGWGAKCRVPFMTESAYHGPS
jgi:hypothetical protein